MIRRLAVQRIAKLVAVAAVATLTGVAQAQTLTTPRLVPACSNATPHAQAVLAERNRHCAPAPLPPTPPPPTPTCMAISSVNIYAGPTGGFTCASISGGVIELQGDSSLYPLYVTANAQLFLQLTYGSGYYPLYGLPFAVNDSSIVVDASAQLASVCSFPLASRVVTIDSIELLTSAGFGGWFVHVYTSPLAYSCS